MKNLRIAISFLTIVVYILSITGNGSAFVLCYGSDGHREIEPSYNGLNCSNTFDAPAYSACSIIKCLSDEHCGSCIDFPLKLSDSKLNEQRESSYQPDLKYAPYVVQSSTFLHDHQVTVINISNFAKLHVIALDSISTIILLI